MTKKAETLDDIWNGDLLQRRVEAEFLQSFLNTLSEDNIRSRDQGSLVINLKGPWGFGKSFFLSRFARQLRASGHKVAELNAWKADPTIDPLVSLMAALENEIRPDLKNGNSPITRAFEVAKTAGGQIAKNAGTAFMMSLLKRFFGTYAEELRGNMEDALNSASIQNSELLSGAAIDAAEDTVESMDKFDLDIQHSSYFSKSLKAAGKQEEAIKNFSESIGKIAAAYKKKRGGKAPFYVIVDELDRCRPTFSIEVLERINHLFDIEGLVFVIGTHSDELKHSISAVYGSKFNSDGYLNRFFDYTYHLAEPKTHNWIKHLINEFSIDLDRYSCPDRNNPYNLLEDIGQNSKLSFRDYKQVFFLMKVAELQLYEFGKIDLITLYVHAIAIQKKQDDIIRKHAASRTKPENSLLDLWKGITIRAQRDSHLYDIRNADMTLTAYISLGIALSEMSYDDFQQKVRNREASTIDEHFGFLLRTQNVSRDPKDGNKVHALWSTYPSLLRTAQRIAHIETD